MQGDLNDACPESELLLAKGEKRLDKGKLTVFLGAAAGVGKTYAMLETAQERLIDGVDIIVGWIETHGRPETEELLHDLPKVPARMIEYRGHSMREMDIDAILEHRPQVVLVDELAHSNVPGSRHKRRFQDVDEILDAGIDVYTTLNIQHIESLNDIVAQIIGVVVCETVPDYILEQADTIQLIDIPPEGLIKRLKEGKVYVPDQAEQALRKFFRPGNLNALRELALRFTAHRVDKDLDAYMREHRIAGPWSAAERVMVAVSASPFSAQLIRTARRLAAGLQAEWIAVHVQTARGRYPTGDAERDRVAQNMRLAEELGAKTITVLGDNFTEEILEVARNYNVTSIVIGKPRHSRIWDYLQGSVVDNLIRRSGKINVYVIEGEPEKDTGPRFQAESRQKDAVTWKHYGGGMAMMALVTGVNLAFKEQLVSVNIALLYMVPVLLSAVWWGRWPSYVTAVASVLAFNFLFIPPIYTLTVADIRYLWGFIIFLFVSFIIGGRTELLRMDAVLARQREKSTRTLYEFSKEIAAVVDMDSVVRGLVNKAVATVDRAMVVLLPDGDGELAVCAEQQPKVLEHPDSTVGIPIDRQNQAGKPLVDQTEQAVATWVFEHGQIAGRSTDTLQGAKYLYLPLKARDNVVGVLGIDQAEKVTPEQRRLIEAWSSLAALAVERVKLAEQARKAQLLVESDRLRTALFNSISHELRTPLASIMGSVSTLLEAEKLYTPEQRRELLETVQEGAVRMERIVANLLDSARLESGMMQLKIDWCDIEDVIGTALRRLGDLLRGHKVIVQMDPDLPMVRADFTLLEQVVMNLVDNAQKYSPQDSEIIISAGTEGDKMRVSVLDNGLGIPTEDLSKIFDKFYRVRRSTSIAGTGLGLSICRGIIEAHGGTIWAEHNVGQGAVVSFTLPLYEYVK